MYFSIYILFSNKNMLDSTIIIEFIERLLGRVSFEDRHTLWFPWSVRFSLGNQTMQIPFQEQDNILGGGKIEETMTGDQLG
jgi:hypothetical protein